MERTVKKVGIQSGGVGCLCPTPQWIRATARQRRLAAPISYITNMADGDKSWHYLPALACKLERTEISGELSNAEY